MSEHVQQVQGNVNSGPSPFAHIYKNRWRTAIISSLVINCFLVGGLIWSFTQKPDLEIDSTPVEISVLGDGPALGGPKISAPAPAAVQAPPPLTAQEVADIQNGVPVKQMMEPTVKPQPTPVVPTPGGINSDYAGNAQGGAVGGTAEGSGSGDGTGTDPNGGSGDGGEGTGGSQTVVEPLQFLGDRSLDGYSGTVVIHVVVNESGRAVEAYVEQSSGDGAYDRAARARAKNSAYSPKTVNGQAVVSEGRITFRN